MLAPVANKVANPPTQILGVDETMFTCGKGFTFSEADLLLVQPAELLTVTEYTELINGLTVKDKLAEPVFHNTLEILLPSTPKFELWPKQISVFVAII